MYVEADASVRSYDDAEGKKQTRTNFTQRELTPSSFDFHGLIND